MALSRAAGGSRRRKTHEACHSTGSSFLRVSFTRAPPRTPSLTAFHPRSKQQVRKSSSSQILCPG